VLAALRRLALLILAGMAGTTAISLLAGAALGASLHRSVAIGFYVVGSFLLVAGFFIGNRGPARVKSETPGRATVPFAWFGARTLRWATLPELYEAINNSAVFVGLGLVMVIVGIVVDGRYHLF
jgi:hypothetical protein